MTSDSLALWIRPMTTRDIPVVAALETKVYPQPWSIGVFNDELAQPNRRYLVADDAHEGIVGYAGLLVVEEDAHITTVAVDTSARRHRIGTRLMLALVDAAIEKGARHLTLEVRVSNAAARLLYERFGFAPVGMRKAYYVDEDAVVMWAIDIDSSEYAARIHAIRASLEVTP
ncbi:MAG TPA: ribosomal protein S18-alanine N-acetyltransferase [Acidimicrobiia bacterium]|jgi:ribosomal-protein-alanine N-acetyltransferase